MWTERPKVWTDGLVLASAVGLALSVIVSFGHDPDPVPVSLPQCQEVVVTVHDGEEILASCPPGTQLDIVSGNVVCRCPVAKEIRRIPRFFFAPPSTQQIPQADPPLQDDKRGTEI